MAGRFWAYVPFLLTQGTTECGIREGTRVDHRITNLILQMDPKTWKQWNIWNAATYIRKKDYLSRPCSSLRFDGGEPTAGGWRESVGNIAETIHILSWGCFPRNCKTLAARRNRDKKFRTPSSEISQWQWLPKASSLVMRMKSSFLLVQRFHHHST